jgi:hypothetical protein
MKVIKDNEGMDDCRFSCVECGENEYPIYCTNEGTPYQNLTEFVYEKWCAIRGRAILENRRWTYSEVFDACAECCLVVVFTSKSGDEWCDPEGKYGRVELSYYDIIEILKFVMRRPTPRKA